MKNWVILLSNNKRKSIVVNRRVKLTQKFRKEVEKATDLILAYPYSCACIEYTDLKATALSNKNVKIKTHDQKTKPRQNTPNENWIFEREEKFSKTKIKKQPGFKHTVSFPDIEEA